MQFSQRSLLLGLPILFVLLLAACGTPPPTTTNTTSSSSSYGSGSTTSATPTTAATSNAVVKTASATIQGKAVTILTNAQGLTLYYFKPDTATTSACTGGCSSNWPPLLATGSAAPSSATTLSGKLTAQTDTNGMQVQYNGHFLYTFASDKAAGDTKGEGIGGNWFVATTDLT